MQLRDSFMSHASEHIEVIAKYVTDLQIVQLQLFPSVTCGGGIQRYRTSGPLWFFDFAPGIFTSPDFVSRNSAGKPPVALSSVTGTEAVTGR
jgi:hypothetical protein